MRLLLLIAYLVWTQGQSFKRKLRREAVLKFRCRFLVRPPPSGGGDAC